MVGLEECLVKIETLGIILLCILQTIWSKDPIIMTDKGNVRGFTQNVLGKHVDTYLGIPFAKPPLKGLRFKHPLPNDAWKSTLNATRMPNTCIQGYDTAFGNFSGSQMWNPNTNVSEDCLYLNVWVPRTNQGLHNAAVMVWIYGGGFYSGTSTLEVYNPTVLAAENEVIVVSMQYRVGMLGFLALGTTEVPGNAGLFDQLMALEWVQNNIEFFGGDPDNVTLFGESAGSVSVSMHLLSPLSRGKFARAILQSGTANTKWATYSRDEARARGRSAAKLFNCPTADLDEMTYCLRRAPPEHFPNNEWITKGIMQFPFVPVIDGVFFVETPDESLEKGNFKKTQILLGSNQDEGNYFLIYQLYELYTIDEEPSISYENFTRSIADLFEYYPYYPKKMNSFGINAISFQYTNWLNIQSREANKENLDDAIGDFHFVCGVNKFAQTYAKFGQNVYYYYFTHRSSMNLWPKYLGVMHADEINYVFGEPLRPGFRYKNSEKQLSRKMMQYWVNFAKTGDPNRSPGLPSLNEWPLHTTESKEYLELHPRYHNQPDKSKAVGNGPRAHECAFWMEYLPQLVRETDKKLNAPYNATMCEINNAPTIAKEQPIIMLILSCLVLMLSLHQ
ncbi:acetylcholinesterase-like isoform X2 [Lineus longissimus]|uniref:acetylcholinesterase-like isoform X2 n=1 Tax=Lineus longissimus TaxID=88925 RepID=UPI002B4D3B41